MQQECQEKLRRAGKSWCRSRRCGNERDVNVGSEKEEEGVGGVKMWCTRRERNEIFNVFVTYETNFS
eukprot:768338-Hanusia_phi.AAC.2